MLLVIDHTVYISYDYKYKLVNQIGFQLNLLNGIMMNLYTCSTSSFNNIHVLGEHTHTNTICESSTVSQ